MSANRRDERSVAHRWLRDALALRAGEQPFPWQSRLLDRFLAGHVDRALDLPTGLGKTSVMGIWLVARALGATLPRRLVYVVDRRAVVDQATSVAESLRGWVDRTPEVAERLGLGRSDGSAPATLPISTLRGQFADNREWLESPVSPAIVVGTVDMVGSRVLFEGYGTSRKMRPYQAGLLGTDALYVIDEAHLVPPFEYLIEALVRRESDLGAGNSEIEDALPVSRILSLSATGRDHGETALRLDDSDRADPVVARRINASKRLEVLDAVPPRELATRVAREAWKLAEGSDAKIRCLIFVNRRSDADAVRKELLKIAKSSRGRGSGLPQTELFVGARRVFERAKAASRLKELGFLAGDAAPSDHAFVVATSAGEVGVDLDADHMVCDLVSWERMVQRLGRVNRRGDGNAGVRVVPVNEEGEDFDRAAVASLLSTLPRGDDGPYDASPSALEELRRRSVADSAVATRLERAITPEPFRPELSRPLVDAWSLTSVRDHPGRPEVAPWLRGWIDDPPRTTVVWRDHVTDVLEATNTRDYGSFMEAAPPHLAEKLETETSAVVNWLVDSMGRAGDSRQRASRALVLDAAGEVEFMFDLTRCVNPSRTQKNAMGYELAGRILVVDSELGGLSDAGLLDPTVKTRPAVADSDPPWMPPSESPPSGSDRTDAAPLVPWRIRRTSERGPTAEPGWTERFRLALENNGDGDVSGWLVVDRWRQDAETEDDRSSAPALVALDRHQKDVEGRVAALGECLGLPSTWSIALRLAARFHDEGKRARRWQRAFRAPTEGGPYAKTPGPPNPRALDGYRHEFGSLEVAERDEDVRALPDAERDLVLHLIAAHHGHARPSISVVGCDDAPPSLLEVRAREVVLRFLRLQRRFGPWGLAYLEAVFRSADQQASRFDGDEGDAP